jgi:hypothetical protein
MTRASRWLRALALGLLLASGPAGSHAAATADGPWQLTIALSSFSDGPLGSVERVIDLSGGKWEGDIRQGQIYLGFRVAIVDGAASGLLAVKAGSQFNAVSVPFQAVVADGAVERQLSGNATMLSSGRKGTQTRRIDIRLRLVRQ